jgi:hypothetical protein
VPIAIVRDAVTTPCLPSRRVCPCCCLKRDARRYGLGVAGAPIAIVRHAVPALALYALAAAWSVMLGLWLGRGWCWIAIFALADARSMCCTALSLGRGWSRIAIVRDAVPALALNALAAARDVMLGAIAWTWRV